jgi:hypothetical protein
VKRTRKQPAPDVSPGPSLSVEAEQERAWQTVQRVQDRNAAISPEEVLADVTAEVEAVRQTMYERSESVDTSSRRP